MSQDISAQISQITPISLQDLPNTQKILEKSINSNTLESLSRLCNSCLLELPPAYSFINLPTDFIYKIVCSLENLKPESDLNRYIPILELFSIISNNLNIPLTNLMVNSLCQFLLNGAYCKNLEIFIQISVKIVEILHNIAVQKKKKSDHFDPAWSGKIFISLCGLIELILQENESNMIIEKVFEPRQRFWEEFKAVRKNSPCDFILYTVSAINHVAKVTSTISAENLISLLPAFLRKVAEGFKGNQKDFESLKILGDKKKVLIEKTVAALDMLNAIAGMMGKIENFRTLLKINSNMIREIFVSAVKAFEQAGESVQSYNIDEDQSILGRLYAELLVICVSTLNSDIENLPILIFSEFLDKTVFLQIPAQVQAFTLQFLYKFLKLGLKKQKIHEIGIISLIFSPEFLLTTQIDWLNITNFLTKIPEFPSWTSSSICNHLRSQKIPKSYLITLLVYINDKIQQSDTLILDLFRAKFIELAFICIESFENSQELFIDLFVLLKSAIYTYEITRDLDTQLSDFMLQESIMTNPAVFDLSLSCLAALLRNSMSNSYESLIIAIKSTQDALALKRILETLQDILNESDRKKICQDSLVNSRIFKVLKELIEKTYNKKDAFILWPAVLELIRFIIHDNVFSKSKLEEFGFKAMSELLRSSDFVDIREALSEVSLEISLYILFENTNLEIFHEVVNPHIVPLVVTMMSGRYSNFSQYLISCIEYPYNSVQFARFGALDAVLNTVGDCEDSRTFGFLMGLIERIVAFNLTPIDLKSCLKVMMSLSIFRQEMMIQVLAKGFSRAFVSNAFAQEKVSQHAVAPTNYFWFRKPESYLKYSAESFMFLPKKDFTIVTWALPLTKNLACLADFNDKKCHFCVYSVDCCLEVCYILDKKSVFRLCTSKVLLENQWNLICITYQQITKFITSQCTFDIIVNNRLCEYQTEGKLSSISTNMTNLIIGNNLEKRLSFNGKIAVFSVLNRAFQDFSFLINHPEFINLPFIPEVFSLYTTLNSADFKELYTSTIFEFTSAAAIENTEDYSVSYEVDKVNGVDVISSLVAVGGLEVFLMLLKDMESQVSLQVIEVVSSFCESSSLGLMVNEEFFEVFSHVLEALVVPSEELLESIKTLLGRLDWHQQFQANAFRRLLINSKIWNNINESLQENYLGSLSLYIHKHLGCVLSDCFPLYTHLYHLGPLPIDFLCEVFSKILPKTIELKNFEAICYLLFRMSVDNPDLLERFLIEMAKARFSKDCLKEITYLLLYFMDWPQNFLIIQGLLSVFRTVIDLLVREYANDKKNWITDELFLYIFSSFDRRLGQDLSPEILISVINISTLSYNFNSKLISDKFSTFIDLITTRVAYLSHDCIKSFIELTKEPKFCEMVTQRPNFPDWLVGLYFNDFPDAQELAVILFSVSLQPSHIYKLRIFLLTVSRQNFNKSLEFYYNVLQKLMKFEAFVNHAHYFIDFAAILEDLLAPELAGKSPIDLPVFICVIVSLIQSAIFLSLIHCTFPPLPKIDFTLQYELLKEKPMETVTQPDLIYLREGGFLRVVLKYIFIGLHYSQAPSLITSLKIVLKGGEEVNYYPGFLKTSSENGFYEVERYSIAYPHFPVRCGDMLYSEEFLCLYILAELTDVLSESADQDTLEFLLEFLQHFDIPTLLVAWSKKISAKELEDFSKIVSDYPQLFYPTTRSRLSSSNRNVLQKHLKSFTTPSHSNFQIGVKDQAQLLSDAKNNENLLRELLSSHNWTIRIHIYLLAFTSMKLNFISSMVKTPNSHIRKFSAPDLFMPHYHLPEDYSKATSAFIISKQEELRQWQNSYLLSEEHAKIIRSKLYDNILKFHKKVENAYGVSKLKLRWRIDSTGRMATCCYDQQKMRSLPMKKTVISKPEAGFKGIIGARGKGGSLFETFTDETEISGPAAETEEEFIDENVPELQQNVQVECERLKVSYSVYGFIEISQNFFLFVSEGKEKPTAGIYLGSALKFMQETKVCSVILKVSEIFEVFPRRFTHKHTAFEIFMRSGKSYLFNVFTPELREKVFEAMKSWKLVKLVLDPTGAILRSYSKKWKRGEISNLEYLLTINRFASRSFNDLSQYPIFPWVLKDYNSEELKLEDPAIYRNLKLPIGAQTDCSRQAAEQRFTMGADDHPYHFGSHYSSGAIVLHYLVRLEPYSTLSKSLQGGNFDIADRLFHSLEASWNSGQGATGDVKELIPEMYYLPELFVNSNSEKLGTRQDGEPVNNVILPKWAKNPIDFIRRHLAALESSQTSQNLHHWIDLVFGNKQKGKQAVNHFNVFCPMSYEENFKKVMEAGESEGYMQGMIEQVVHFGQTPVRVFHSPHAAKDLKAAELTIFDKYRKFSENVSNGCRMKGEVSALLLSSKYLILVKHLRGKVSILRISLNEFDENHVMFEKKKEKFLQFSRPGRENSSLHYCLLGDNKIVSGNQTDNSLKVHTLSGILTISICGHTDIVTTVVSYNHYIFSGSADSSVFCWQHTNNKFSLYCRYLGHTTAIAQVSAIISHSLLCSLSIIGDLLIHEIRTGECLSGIKSNFLRICTSSLKLIAGYNKREVQVMDLQGQVIWKKISCLTTAKFDHSGENLVYSKGLTWGFWNIFDQHKKFKKREENLVNCVQVSTQQNYFVHSELESTHSLVYTFQTVNKENIMANQRINF